MYRHEAGRLVTHIATTTGLSGPDSDCNLVRQTADSGISINQENEFRCEWSDPFGHIGF